MSTHQKRILAPTSGPETWKQFLAKPEKHWKPLHSAMSMAYSWEKSFGLPSEIAMLFKSAKDVAFHDVELALAIPEYKVNLEGGERPSQNDVFALLTCSGGLISMTVEGKATEDFDGKLGSWKKRTSKNGVDLRLGQIMAKLGLKTAIPDRIKYQLLHRTASSVIEAERFHAPYAVVVVQSFVTDDSRNHYDDFCEFIQMFGKIPSKNTLIEISKPCGKRLFAAWVQSEPT